jgi:phosphohistidine swiveling domain-containing protein
VAVKYSKVAEAEHPVLLATLISAGLQGRYFQEATGWDFGVQHHKYESGGHYISDEDLESLGRLVSEKLQSDSDLWTNYVSRGKSKGSDLIATARSLATGGDQAGNPKELKEGFTALAEATMQMAPFLAASRLVRAEVESLVTSAINQEAGEEQARDIVARVLGAEGESEAVREIRNCYRLALEIAESDEAKELVLDKLPATAVSQMENQFPDLYERLRDHVDEYGWIRGQVQGLDPLSMRDLVERIQGILLRWKPAMIRQAAERDPQLKLDDLLGFSPSESLERLIWGLKELATERPFHIDVHLQAFGIARQFFAKVAEAVGCGPEQLAYSSAEEIMRALSEEGELPISEIDRRIQNSFWVERSGDDLRLNTLEAPPGDREGAQTATITGQTVCRGRAVGTVRLIFGATEVVKLEVGDVLVSEASTPDKMGTESAFPGRTDAPLGLEKAGAIVTDEGGLLSHAAIISRELGVPCVVGTERATSTLVDGQVVEVDATKGTGRVIAWEPSPEVSQSPTD